MRKVIVRAFMSTRRQTRGLNRQVIMVTAITSLYITIIISLQPIHSQLIEHSTHKWNEVKVVVFAACMCSHFITYQSSKHHNHRIIRIFIFPRLIWIFCGFTCVHTHTYIYIYMQSLQVETIPFLEWKLSNKIWNFFGRC